jgi:polyhydroxybutyrate depolymerase
MSVGSMSTATDVRKGFRMARFPQLWRSLLLGAILFSGVYAGSTVAKTSVSSGVTSEQKLVFDGRERTFRVHVPDMDSSTTTFPLLIVLHGGTGNGGQIERSSGFSDLADQFGFIAVYPDGAGAVNSRYTWNADNCCGYAYRQHVDDVGFIAALIDQLVADYDVDPSRVYVTGFSNGAMMTFRLACELSGKIAAAAPYAGALNTDSCGATEPVSILIMNGDADQIVPVDGGTSDQRGAAGERDRVDKPTSFAVDTWVAIDGCFGTPEVTNSATSMTSTYSGCTNGAAVEQVLIHNWDHHWPSEANGSSMDAGSIIWEFVSQFSKTISTQVVSN